MAPHRSGSYHRLAAGNQEVAYSVQDLPASQQEASTAQSSAKPAMARQGTTGLGPASRHTGWQLRLPKTALLCKMLAAMVALLVVFHAASCGYFFCVQFPKALDFPHSMYDDVREVYRLTGGPRIIQSRASDYGRRDEAPKLIPKIIHQTYKSNSVPRQVRPFMQSWRRQNAGWEIRFYDDEACLEFVQREFPEYMDAYRRLPKDVERSDFFRYMVILRLGGVYADVDTECRTPMDDLIQARDTLVVGWENEFSSDAEAERRHYVRTRQLLQWVFAGAPGHPALREICDHIAAHAVEDPRSKNNTNRETLERTGPGLWTDVVLKHAMLHPPANRDDPWDVRVLAKVYWGAHPAGLDGIPPDDDGISVMHHFLGSWKVRGGWRRRNAGIRTLPQKLWTLYKALFARRGGLFAQHSLVEAEVLEGDLGGPPQLYPTSVSFEPPFTLLTNLIGSGDPQSGVDVSATITAWGFWQPAISPSRRPSVADALVGSLGGSNSEHQVLLDIGAGCGFFSLAAAARGRQAIAVELSPRNLDVLQASVAFNGFERLVRVERVALGAAGQQEICVERSGVHETAMARGYAMPQAHDVEQPGCTRVANRTTVSGLVPPGVEVGAVRISASGWEGWIVDGMEELVRRQPPPVILVELHPALTSAAGYGSATQLLRKLHAAGYTDISHSGRFCDARWYDITRSIRLRGAMGLAAQEALKQPTWCRLQPDTFDALAQRAHTQFPENILFIYKPAVNKAEKGQPHAAEGAGKSGGWVPAAERPGLKIPKAAPGPSQLGPKVALPAADGSDAGVEETKR